MNQQEIKEIYFSERGCRNAIVINDILVWSQTQKKNWKKLCLNVWKVAKSVSILVFRLAGLKNSTNFRHIEIKKNYSLGYEALIQSFQSNNTINIFRRTHSTSLKLKINSLSANHIALLYIYIQSVHSNYSVVTSNFPFGKIPPNGEK